MGVCSILKALKRQTAHTARYTLQHPAYSHKGPSHKGANHMGFRQAQ